MLISNWSEKIAGMGVRDEKSWRDEQDWFDGTVNEWGRSQKKKKEYTRKDKCITRPCLQTTSGYFRILSVKVFDVPPPTNTHCLTVLCVPSSTLSMAFEVDFEPQASFVLLALHTLRVREVLKMYTTMFYLRYRYVPVL